MKPLPPTPFLINHTRPCYHLARTEDVRYSISFFAGPSAATAGRGVSSITLPVVVVGALVRVGIVVAAIAVGVMVRIAVGGVTRGAIVTGIVVVAL